MLRAITIVVLLAIGVLAYVAWTKNTQKAVPDNPAGAPAQSAPEGMPPGMGGDGSMPPQASGGMPPQGGEVAPPPAADPGVKWSVPKRWTEQQAGSMRLATYGIPGSGGAEQGQCAVYYFGPGQGGPVDANLERWAGEFKDPTAAKRSSMETNGMKVSRVTSNGVYLAHGGGMSGGAPEEKQDWSLIGAIVEGPQGNLFFKLTGPAATVKAAEAEFEGMLKSMKK